MLQIKKEDAQKLLNFFANLPYAAVINSEAKNLIPLLQWLQEITPEVEAEEIQ